MTIIISPRHDIIYRHLFKPFSGIAKYLAKIVMSVKTHRDSCRSHMVVRTFSLCKCYKTNSCSIRSRKRCVIGGNAGRQCVAMSLCALVYSKKRKITSFDDIIQIMIVGNQLYSSLSLLKRHFNSQSMLMLLTELPGMVTVFERFFQLELLLN